MPAVRNIDNKPGLIDMMTGEFLTNQGTGEFTYGDEIGYEIVEYIKGRGDGSAINSTFTGPGRLRMLGEFDPNGAREIMGPGPEGVNYFGKQAGGVYESSYYSLAYYAENKDLIDWRYRYNRGMELNVNGKSIYTYAASVDTKSQFWYIFRIFKYTSAYCTNKIYDLKL